MKMIPKMCTQCGAQLHMEKGDEVIVCPYCDTEYTIEKPRWNPYENGPIVVKLNYASTGSSPTGINVVNGSGQSSVAEEREFNIDRGVLVRYGGTSTDVMIPQEVAAIGNNAFLSKKIKSVIMSDHVTEIREGAFYNCDALKTVTLSKNLRVIGSYAFWGCKSLENIVLPNGLKEIGRDAFADSFKLQLYLPDSLEKLDPRYNHFKGCHSVYLSSRLVYKLGTPPIWSQNVYIDSVLLTANMLQRDSALMKAMRYTLIGNQIEKEAYYEESRRQGMIRQWMCEGLCRYCGGEFGGTFIKKCNNCRRKKDY